MKFGGGCRGGGEGNILFEKVVQRYDILEYAAILVV
jgi:hypothetical protein